MILGTAGHIDHGKTALVRALTGVDTDRLPEEKRRGITIDLGFAPLVLDGMGTIGVIDVPGHEAFVRTMLAGATGIDLAMLVIAADEGVRPQTREHLTILTMLGVRAGVVALTKTDLVDGEWLELVTADVSAVLQGSGLDRAPIVPVSGKTGAGMDDLRAAIRAAASAVTVRETDDIFRMPIDRAFSVRGTGTVVTGTVWSGELRKGPATIFPGGHAVRVRDLQSHGSSVERVSASMRAAVALSGVTVEQAGRGSVLVAGDGWEETSIMLAELTPAASQVEITPRTRVRLHLGAADVGARVRLFDPDRGGMRLPARIRLEEPVIARAGDRFVLRAGSPLEVIAGGVVTDPLPLDRRPKPGIGAEARIAERLLAACEQAGGKGIDRRSLPVRLGGSPRAIAALASDERFRFSDQKAYARSVLAELVERVPALVQEAQVNFPSESGVQLEELRGLLRIDGGLVEEALRLLVENGSLEIHGTIVSTRGWKPRLSSEQSDLAERMVHAFCSSGEEPPGLGEVVAKHGDDVLPVLRFLEREGRLIRISGDFLYCPEVVDRMVGRLAEAMREDREYSPAEVKDAVGTSRKYLIPFLEFCDRTRITERRGAGRVLRNRQVGRP
ncbi:MAG TPA: selenocysteine-specific translation elongation factor [Gemmatimonadaceae bacterium]|nr:selenocysteine-specific translation elongation factor [Gemmatimonadaceae bacterium]